MGLFRKKKKPGKYLSVAEERQFWTELKRTMATTSKQLVWLFSINGVLWIWCSYILAFMGKDQVVETLSSSVCTVIVGELVVYLVTSTCESIFKYNIFSFSKPKNMKGVHDDANSSNTAGEYDPSTVGPDDGSGDPGEPESN